MIVYSIGHGTRWTDELVRALRSHGVTRLVDVRRYPGSRRNPHLARAPLEEELPSLGISYEWWGKELGGRRTPAPGSRHPGWDDDAFRGFADYTDTPEFRTALDRLEDTAQKEHTAMMCAETLWWRCHRRIIADHLHARGHDVVHILDESRAAPHRVPETMRVDQVGAPVYDVGVTAELDLDE